jgi:hypothetical protein
VTRALPLLLALAACAPPETYAPAGNPDAAIVSWAGISASVQIVDVDGVRCAVLVGFKGNAIDCDFGGGE